MISVGERWAAGPGPGPAALTGTWEVFEPAPSAGDLYVFEGGDGGGTVTLMDRRTGGTAPMRWAVKDGQLSLDIGTGPRRADYEISRDGRVLSLTCDGPQFRMRKVDPRVDGGASP